MTDIIRPALQVAQDGAIVGAFLSDTPTTGEIVATAERLDHTLAGEIGYVDPRRRWRLLPGAFGGLPEDD